MTSVPQLFVGIDYHQDNVQVCVLDKNERQILNRSFVNDADVIRRAIAKCGQVAGVAIEACCGAANLADELHGLTNWPLQLAHPGYVARLKQSPDKSDFSDARLLADLERVGYVPKVWLAPEQIRQLRRLIRHRQQLVNSRRSVKLRLRALLRENRIKAPVGCNAWTKAWLAWVVNLDVLSTDDRWLMDQHLAGLQQLTTQIKAVEKRLADRVKDDPVVAKLLTFQGVGFVTAVTMCAGAPPGTDRRLVGWSRAPSTMPVPWRIGICRIASPFYVGVWKMNGPVRGHVNSSAFSDFWRSTRCPT